MKGVRVLLITLGLVVLVAQCAFSAQVWTHQRVTFPGEGANTPIMGPNNTVYWVDDNSNQIKAWDPTGGVRAVKQVSAGTALEAVYGNQFLYTVSNGTGLDFSLYVWDGANPDQLISTTVRPYSNSMYGNLIAYGDTRTGVEQIHVYDLTTSLDTAISPTTYGQEDPKVWGDTVVFTDYRSGWDAPRVRKWAGGTITIIGSGSAPAVYEDKIVWWNGPALWQRTPSGTTKLVQSTGATSSCSWGDLVVWSTGVHSIGAWDPVNGVTRIDDGTGVLYADQPSMCGRNVAWIATGDNGLQGLYVSTFVPEPNSLFSLSVLFFGASGALLRRRRRSC